jgi:DNA-directed RNA polymerase subunit M/transcription elongation factor TFIIS
MTVSGKMVTCSNCGQVLSTSTSTEDELGACPKCGSTAKTFHVSLETRVSVHEKVSGKVRSSGDKKPRKKFVFGQDLWRKMAKWVHLERVMDRENNRYHERVVDPATGEIIHECEEPLSEHRGHGSDKPNKH